MIAECRSARRCVAYDRATGRAGWPALDGGPLCDGCLGRAAADIAALPRDHAALAAELAPAGRGNAPHVSGGDPEAPIPLALPVDALQRDIAWALAVWEAPVREAAGLPCPPVPSWWAGRAVAAAVRVIAPRVRLLAGLGPTWGYADGLDAGPVERDGVAGISALSALHVAAERAVGATLATRMVQGLCQGCGAPALLRVDGSDSVACRVCERSQTLGQYEQYIGLILGSAS